MTEKIKTKKTEVTVTEKGTAATTSADTDKWYHKVRNGYRSTSKSISDTGTKISTGWKSFTKSVSEKWNKLKSTLSGWKSKLSGLTVSYSVVTDHRD